MAEPFPMVKWSTFITVCVALWVGLSPHPALAQNFDLETSRLPISQIDSAWRFHLGDNPAWSQPALDDSAWPVLKPTKSWIAQGVPESAQIVWFRFRLHAPANTASMVLELPTLHKSYQLFAGGELIAQVGTLPPSPAHNVIAASRVFTIPIGSGSAAKDVTLALRTWQDPSLAGSRNSRVNGNVYIGASGAVLQHFTASRAIDLLSDGALYSVNLLSLVVGASALYLFWLTRERFYLWFALSLVLEVMFQPVDYAAQHQAWDFYFYTYFEILLDVITATAYILFVVDAIFPGRWKLVLLPSAFTCTAELGILLVLWHSVPLMFGDVTYCVAEASTRVVLAWYLIRGWRAGNTYAWLLLYPIGLQTLGSVFNNLGFVLNDFNVSWALNIVPDHIAVIDQPFGVALNQLIDVVVLLAFLAVLVYRFAHTSREKQRLATAMQAARDIQQRLVPEDIPILGGLQVEIAYRAAEEVGGDFCQVLPRPDGSTFIAIGDVSGKGLQAAMLGAVAVGSLRSLAGEQMSPARVLERLNQAMLQRESPGFVTCLCLVISPDGNMEAANAGHLAPYLDVRELPLESGLPLGIVSGLSYEQASFILPPSARLMLLSDGVVEARSRTGELFGFDRTSLISRYGASEIAAQAHRFGQQDDITVITLDWKALDPIPELV
ncbi:MAG: PP2C family protein-serine/threonine phosphatase [Terracidiphilus sp.]